MSVSEYIGWSDADSAMRTYASCGDCYWDKEDDWVLWVIYIGHCVLYRGGERLHLLQTTDEVVFSVCCGWLESGPKVDCFCSWFSTWSTGTTATNFIWAGKAGILRSWTSGTSTSIDIREDCVGVGDALIRDGCDISEVFAVWRGFWFNVTHRRSFRTMRSSWIVGKQCSLAELLGSI